MNTKKFLGYLKLFMLLSLPIAVMYIAFDSVGAGIFFSIFSILGSILGYLNKSPRSSILPIIIVWLSILTLSYFKLQVDFDLLEIAHLALNGSFLTLISLGLLYGSYHTVKRLTKKNEYE